MGWRCRKDIKCLGKDVLLLICCSSPALTERRVMSQLNPEADTTNHQALNCLTHFEPDCTQWTTQAATEIRVRDLTKFSV